MENLIKKIKQWRSGAGSGPHGAYTTADYTADLHIRESHIRTLIERLEAAQDTHMLKVWAWKDAPEEYKKYSLMGGEDWVIVCSPAEINRGHQLARALSSRDCQRVGAHVEGTATGEVLYIVYHV